MILGKLFTYIGKTLKLTKEITSKAAVGARRYARVGKAALRSGTIGRVAKWSAIAVGTGAATTAGQYMINKLLNANANREAAGLGTGYSSDASALLDGSLSNEELTRLALSKMRDVCANFTEATNKLVRHVRYDDTPSDADIVKLAHHFSEFIRYGLDYNQYSLMLSALRTQLSLVMLGTSVKDEIAEPTIMRYYNGLSNNELTYDEVESAVLDALDLAASGAILN